MLFQQTKLKALLCQTIRMRKLLGNGSRSNPSLLENRHSHRDGSESNHVQPVKCIFSTQRPNNQPSTSQKHRCQRVGPRWFRNQVERLTTSTHKPACRLSSARQLSEE